MIKSLLPHKSEDIAEDLFWSFWTGYNPNNRMYQFSNKMGYGYFNIYGFKQFGLYQEWREKKQGLDGLDSICTYIKHNIL